MKETLLTAARRVVRFTSIDLNNGGLLSVETQQSLETLHKMVLRANLEEERLAKAENREPWTGPRYE